MSKIKNNGNTYQEKEINESVVDDFFNLLLDRARTGENLFVSVHLTSGVSLKGVIINKDDNCVILYGYGKAQLIYKNIIGTICPEKPSDFEMLQTLHINQTDESDSIIKNLLNDKELSKDDFKKYNNKSAA